jgi:hypothetical protein
MKRRLVSLLIVLFSIACNEGGTIDPFLPGLDVAPVADGAGDLGIAGDLAGDATVVAPDGSPLVDGADTNENPDLSGDQTSLADGDGGALLDGNVGETEDLVTGDAAPFEPFAGCTNGSPCPHPQEPLCLLLPNSDEGLCVKPCGGGDGGCAPWLECVQPDSGNPDLQVCLDIADLGEECSATDGLVCTPGTFCVIAEETGVCTTFCTPGEGICPVGTTCTLVDPDDASWGACLAAPDLPQCEQGGDCKENEICAELVPGFLRCAPVCDEAGAGCGTFGLCTSTLEADGSPGNACITYQEQGQICDTAKGLFCQAELKCIDLQAADGWNRCLKDCFGGQCEAGYACKQPDGAPKEFCLPLAMTLPEPTFCNETYPCPDDWQVCTQGEGDATGICAPPCGEEGGCPIGQSCKSGGCVPAAPVGSPCLAGKGLFCEGDALCLADKGQEDEAGHCATLCEEGDNGECGGLTTCQPAGEDLFACLVAGGWGTLCSLDEGTACDSAAGLHCLHISSDDDNGFCTGTCEGPGTCAQEVENATAECMIQKAGTWYCAFICGGGFGSICPDGMSCSGFGMCAP